jgi:predicted RNase H-like HicB family nuclease
VKYAIVIETGPDGYGAYVPDLPGCVAAAKTLGQVKKLIAEAVPFHLEGMRLHGETIPEPSSLCDYVEVCGDCVPAAAAKPAKRKKGGK